MKYGSSRGFTLIELMVVVGIIGIVMAIILTPLLISRKKAGDAAVKTSLTQARNRAELVFSTVLTNTYGTNAYSNTCGAIAVAANPSYVFQDANFQAILDDAINKGGGEAKCAAGDSWYVLAVPLRTDSANAWCIDNTGVRTQITFSTFASGDQTCAQAGS